MVRGRCYMGCRYCGQWRRYVACCTWCQMHMPPKVHTCSLGVHHSGAGNDYQKELQFKKLNAQKDVIEVKLIRSGEEQLVTNSDVVVVSSTGAVCLPWD